MVVLNLDDEKERFIFERIQHTHRGRWPLFKAYAMRRVGDVIFEVAEWNPKRSGPSPRTFTVLTWDVCRSGLSWLDCPTLAQAKSRFAAMAESDRTTRGETTDEGTAENARR